MAATKKHNKAINLTGNRLLDALPSDDRAALLSVAIPFSPPQGRVVYRQGSEVGSVYFPITAMYSLVLNLDRGDKAEVATIGNEGFVGLPVFFGLRRSPYDAMLQVEGEALQVPARKFSRLISSNQPLAELISRFGIYSLHCANQLVGCNAFHSLEERACRWLLLTQDRAGSNRFDLTQEFLAEMLGVTRQSVTIVAGTLQRAGMIAYKRGAITVLNRAGLEDAACECYRAIQRFYRETVSETGESAVIDQFPEGLS
jgi:CRP-like cAMP-binding protein